MIMKNKILLSVCSLFSVASFAQQVTFGAGAGITNTGMRGDAVQSMQQLLDVTDGILTTKSVTGFYAGGFANIPVSENLSIEPGLYYSAKGYELGGNYSIKGIGLLSAHASTRLRSSYIDMPVLLKVNLNGFQVFAGPQLSYLTSAKNYYKCRHFYHQFNYKQNRYYQPVKSLGCRTYCRCWLPVFKRNSYHRFL